MIKNIVFDIGNVLVDYRWREHINECGFEGETARRLGEAMMLSPIWQEVDRGVWTDEELLNGFIKNAPDLEKEIRMVFSNLRTLVGERHGSRPWLRALKKEGYQLYYLSNFAGRVKQEAKDRLTFLNEMDGGIMSYEVQLIKPDPAIYRALFEQYGLKPEESVFLDDSEANIKTARELGMYTVLVINQGQAMKNLQELLTQINK